jgi:hypothetical protein
MKWPRGREQKKWRRERLWKSREVEKSKNDFPTPLGNPANPAGFPLSHSLGDYGRLTKNRTFHLLTKGDTSNVVSMGTFLMSVDKDVLTTLTDCATCPRLLSHPGKPLLSVYQRGEPNQINCEREATSHEQHRSGSRWFC